MDGALVGWGLNLEGWSLRSAAWETIDVFRVRRKMAWLGGELIPACQIEKLHSRGIEVLIVLQPLESWRSLRDIRICNTIIIWPSPRTEEYKFPEALKKWRNYERRQRQTVVVDAHFAIAAKRYIPAGTEEEGRGGRGGLNFWLNPAVGRFVHRSVSSRGGLNPIDQWFLSASIGPIWSLSSSARESFTAGVLFLSLLLLSLLWAAAAAAPIAHFHVSACKALYWGEIGSGYSSSSSSSNSSERVFWGAKRRRTEMASLFESGWLVSKSFFLFCLLMMVFWGVLVEWRFSFSSVQAFLGLALPIGFLGNGEKDLWVVLSSPCLPELSSVNGGFGIMGTVWEPLWLVNPSLSHFVPVSLSLHADIEHV